MNNFSVYSKIGCPYCTKVISVLKLAEQSYSEYKLGRDFDKQEFYGRFGEGMGYQCKSCVYCQASVSLLSRKIKEKKVDDIKKFIKVGEQLFEDAKVSMEKHWKDFKEILDKKNLSRKECLLLPLRTIAKALKI